MAETIGISEIAEKISDEIFSHFLWEIHPRRNDNFQCKNANHTSASGTQKTTHPGDVIFHYEDPYLGKRIFLHTDLKSYSEASVNKSQLTGALQSLSMAVECANQSAHWREKYSVDNSQPHEVRGLLFVHNYTKGYEKSFHDLIASIKLDKLPLPPNLVLHFLGPRDVNRLWTIVNDIIRLIGTKKISDSYTFFYPDLAG